MSVNSLNFVTVFADVSLLYRDSSELPFAFHLLSTRTESVRLSIPRRRAQSVQRCMSPPHPPESPPVVRSHSFHCLHRVTACIKVADWRPKGEKREGRTADRTATFVSPPNPREKALLRSMVPPRSLLLFDLPDRDQSKNFLNGTSDRDSLGGP